MKNPQKILITGATSGLGKALALEYANKNITLFLTGRNEARLNEIVKICEQKGSKVVGKIVDVKDKSKMAEFASEIGNIDLAIANSGISAGTSAGSESELQINEIFSTNINGVLNTINPLLDSSLGSTKRHGNPKTKLQIAIISSLAGFRGLPSSPAYCASKACVRVYGEALRGSLAPFGIAVNVICPGYIKTPMTDVNEFPMPFLMDAKKAAKIIKKGLAKNKSRIAFPFPLYFIVWLSALISTTITCLIYWL
jgi:short-subunit dehydrogenase